MEISAGNRWEPGTVQSIIPYGAGHYDYEIQSDGRSGASRVQPDNDHICALGQEAAPAIPAPASALPTPSAEGSVGRFKPGDRVEIISGTRWIKATIKRLAPYAGGNFDYEVEADGVGGSSGSVYRMPPDEAHIRSAHETSRPANAATLDKAAPNEASTPRLKDYHPRSDAPSAELFGKVIKAKYDQEAAPGSDGSVTATIKKLEAGTPYRWTPGVDLHFLGDKAKTIYPVKVRFTTVTDYRTRWAISDYEDYTFGCYQEDNFGEWVCALIGTGKVNNRSLNKE